MEAVAQEVSTLRSAAHADMLLSLDTSPATAIDELTTLKAGLKRVEAEVCGLGMVVQG